MRLLFATTALVWLLSIVCKGFAAQTTQQSFEKNARNDAVELDKLQHLMKVLTMEEQAMDLFQRIKKRSSRIHRFGLISTASLGSETASNASIAPLTGDCTEDAYEITKTDPEAFCAVAKKECQINGVLFNYLELPYCTFPHTSWLAVIILVGWLMVLFIWLITTVDFLCPNLITATELLGLSDRVAGLTILAIGNGSSDISSMISGALSGPQGLEMVVGEVLGNGMFVFCFVQGFIAFLAPFTVRRSEFLRDAACYLMGLLLTLMCIMDGIVTLVEACAFLVLYLIYVSLVLNYEAVLGLLGMRRIDDDDNPSEPAESTHLLPENVKVHVYRFDHNASPVHEQILQYLNPIDSERWYSVSWPERVIDFLKAPAVVIQRISVPILDNQQPNMLWNQKVVMCQLFVGPIFSFLMMVHYQGIMQLSDPTIQTIGLLVAISIGATCSALVYFTSSRAYPPNYYRYLCFIGFAMSIQWIYRLADEIVAVILVIGITCHFQKVLLGATILAIGIGLQDLVTNIGVTRSGHPNMAAAACIGSPLLNLMIGLGSACIVGNLFMKSPYPFLSSIHDRMFLTFLIVAILVAMIMMFVNSFKATFAYATVLMAMYACFFLASVILSFVGKDPDFWPPPIGFDPLM